MKLIKLFIIKVIFESNLVLYKYSRSNECMVLATTTTPNDF